MKFINPQLFFYFNDKKIIAWDYKNHRQFELVAEHINYLFQVAEGQQLPAAVETQLVDLGLIVDQPNSLKWQWDRLSEIFHYGTCITSQTAGIDYQLQHCLQNSAHLAELENNLFFHRQGEDYMLPASAPIPTIDFIEVLKQRKTCRDFHNKNLSAAIFSGLLANVFGISRNDHQEYAKFGLQYLGMRKTSPAAGGLHSTEAYVVILNVEGFKPGIYHFNVSKHCLTLINAQDLRHELDQALCQQDYANDLAFGVFLTARFDKLWQKYPHSRAYRMALIDVGHVSQTFQLLATAYHLDPWLTGAFNDELARQWLHISEDCEHPLFFVGAGFGNKSSLDIAHKQLGLAQ